MAYSFDLEPSKWGSSPKLGSTGGTVTWSFAGANTTGKAYTWSDQLTGKFADDIRAAFADWSKYAQISFVQVSDSASSNIRLGWTHIDGPYNQVGEAMYSYTVGGNTSWAEVKFDKDESWQLNSAGQEIDGPNGASFFAIALHEIGHALGLGHHTADPTVMAPVSTPAVSDLTGYDIAAIQTLYGAAPSVTNSVLVDDAFYYKQYADVAKAGISPDEHYAQSGWKEGRNPNADFSTSGYLSANPDVAKAGINPLDHYHQFGWKEGRDPSAAFDNERYLEHNPDVKAAGIDPLAHYLQSGQAEGRQGYAAVGKAQDFTHGSFDAEYYLLANPDVGKAGMDPYRHFDHFGWKEGRNPNAFFDTKGYLMAYGDVKAAGMDPLTHYDQFGWTEARDSSANFDTKQYLAHYADVANAHIDPLMHYLQYGIHEGRSAFADGHFF